MRAIFSLSCKLILCIVVVKHLFNSISDNEHIHKNPEIQWELGEIKKEEEEFEEEFKERYREEQGVRRRKRREQNREYRKEKFGKLPEDERKRILEALQKRRERRWLEERQLYEQALAIQSQPITGEGKTYLRRKIHADVKRL